MQCGVEHVIVVVHVAVVHVPMQLVQVMMSRMTQMTLMMTCLHISPRWVTCVMTRSVRVRMCWLDVDDANCWMGGM